MVKRTSLNLQLELVARAREILGTSGTTDTIHVALREIVRREQLKRLVDRRFELTPEEEDRLDWGAPLDGSTAIAP